MTIRIHHLNCGTLCPACQRLINGSGNWTRPARLVCHCLLIETAEALVLVDTGIGSHDIERPGQRLGKGFVSLVRPRLSPDETAIARIRALGFDPRDVRHIVPTHLDLDHAGGLSDFPEAQVHVFRPELETALNPGLRDRMRFRQAQYAHQPNWVSHDEGGERWFDFSSIRAIPGLDTDILMIPLAGHTRGHVGVAVKNGDKWLLHCGDAYFHRSQITPEPNPPLGLKFFESLVQTLPAPRRVNQARLRSLAQRHGDEVELFCAHDPVEMDRYEEPQT